LARVPLSTDERKRWRIISLVAALLAVALRWPALDIGRLSDDYIQHAMLAGLYPGHGYAPFDLYAFMRGDVPLAAHVEAGTAPWFSEPGFRAAMLRPLASALLWLDHRVAPNAVRLWHLHSLVWLAATVYVFGACARRLVPRWPALLALALLVCEAAFVSPVGWLANRCVLISAAFGFAAVFVHVERRRPDPSTPLWLVRAGPWVELGLVALSLAGGEYGIGAAAYIFAWELFAADRWAARLRALAPVAAALAAYLVIHVSIGYGTFGAEVYADPIHSPRGWLGWAKLRLPKLATGALWSLPASSVTVFFHPGASWWLSLDPASDPIAYHQSHARLGALGIGLALVGLALARAGLDDDERRSLRAVVLGGALGLVPISAAPSHSRLLVMAQLGACVAVALMIVACVRLVRGHQHAETHSQTRAQTRARLRGLALVPFAAAMLAAHVVGDLRWNLRYLRHLAGLHSQNVLAFTTGDLLEQPLAGRDVLVLNGPSQTTAMYGPFVLAANGHPVPASWRSLALGANHPMVALRIDAQTLELSAIDGAWLQTAGELFFRRADHLLAPGDRLVYPSMSVEIIDAPGGLPTKVQFRFAHDLDDPRYLFLVSTEAGLESWQPPALGRRSPVPFPALPAPAGPVGFPERAPTSSGPK